MSFFSRFFLKCRVLLSVFFLRFDEPFLVVLFPSRGGAEFFCPVGVVPDIVSFSDAVSSFYSSRDSSRDYSLRFVEIGRAHV